MHAASGRGAAGYGRLWSLYNHRALYANVQVDDVVQTGLSFDVLDTAAWLPYAPRPTCLPWEARAGGL